VFVRSRRRRLSSPLYAENENIMKTVATFIALGLLSLNANAEWLGDWLIKNEPRVISYLLSLKPEDVGKRIEGVELSDGTRELNDRIFLGRVKNAPPKTHIYVFKENDSTLAYIWVDEDGESFLLPECKQNAPKNWPGWGGAVISGDVYTFDEVSPGGDIVKTYCPSDDWK